jgi:DNA-binding response OmpR family regulator
MPDLASLPGIKRAQLQGRQVLYDDGQHLVILDGTILAFTPVEYTLLLRLLKRAGEPVSFQRLLGVSAQQPLARSMRRSLKQRMSHLRPRLWPFGLDILCLHEYGYLLLAHPSAQAAER